MSELSTPEANRLLYAEHASSYDETEHCIAHERVRSHLDALLEKAVATIGSDAPRVLDACGGTGNVSELLAADGIATTVVDLSPEMLAGWSAKAEQLGVHAETIVSEIEPFLNEDGREWDLIVFSSALHHLDDYVAVARLAASRLAPGGVLVSAYDPVLADDRGTLFMRRFDYLLSLALHPRHLRAAMHRRREAQGGTGEVNYGAQAELHALTGVDDEAIVSALRGDGLEIVEHRRYAMQRYRLSEWLSRAANRPTTFHLIARRPAAAPSA